MLAAFYAGAGDLEDLRLRSFYAEIPVAGLMPASFASMVRELHLF